MQVIKSTKFSEVSGGAQGGLTQREYEICASYIRAMNAATTQEQYEFWGDCYIQTWRYYMTH